MVVDSVQALIMLPPTGFEEEARGTKPLCALGLYQASGQAFRYLYPGVGI